MCRFLLIKSENAISPEELLSKFASSVEKSRTPDGDLQEDGWGFAWFDENENIWNSYKSLRPIWKDIHQFSNFPKSNVFLAHARSASFPNQKGIPEFNQPYINGKYAFVFNGLLKGVSLPNVPGKIGAEKIWNMLQEELVYRSPSEALEVVKRKLIKVSREIVALNIGLASRNSLYSLNYFTLFPGYYQLFRKETQELTIVCSTKIS